MFSKSSRYAALKQLKYKSSSAKTAGGKDLEIIYAARRFIPNVNRFTIATPALVTNDDRLDNVTYKYLADPTLFWWNADANDVMHPEELESEYDKLINIPTPIVNGSDV